MKHVHNHRKLGGFVIRCGIGRGIKQHIHGHRNHHCGGDLPMPVVKAIPVVSKPVAVARQMQPLKFKI